MPRSHRVITPVRALICSLALVATWPALARADTARFEIKAEPLSIALRTFAQQAHMQLLYEYAIVRDVRGNSVIGVLEKHSALEALLRNTGLEAIFSSDSAATIRPISSANIIDPPKPSTNKSSRKHGEGEKPPSGPAGIAKPNSRAATAIASVRAIPQNTAQEEAPALQQITVTGTHIRGVPSTSSVIKITQKQMIQAGQTNLGQVIRSQTVNFGGGENPGVTGGASVASINNQNLNGASSVNLRGLGPDASLTLLDGRRLSYDAFTQAVDISQIPLAAVESIEILPDGASAIYGSDAVAGVVNVKLKRDYSGLAATARYSDATQGGDQQQQYSVVGGRTWKSGGFILAFDYEHNTPIYTTQREYTRALAPGGTLYDGARHDNLLLHMHQNLSSQTTLSLIALYNRRRAEAISTQGPAALYTEGDVVATYMVSPTLTWHLPEEWRVALNITDGRDDDHYAQSGFAGPGGASFFHVGGCYCNTLSSAEMDADGTLLRLPAGEAHVAVGAGYRKVVFDEHDYTDVNRVSGERRSYYAFGEVFIPVVSPHQDVPLTNRLDLDGALRYENYYGSFGSVVTPKLGLLYAPSSDFELKASWGESFKTPTLLQTYESPLAYLWPAAELGASGYPSTATALMSYGGNPALQPERATTWSATLTFHPVWLSGLKTALGYFRIKYRNRVLQPIAELSTAFINPAYRQYLTANPTLAQIQALQGSVTQLINYSGAAYDPSNVIALIDDLYNNAARQDIHGFDLSSSYHFTVADGVVDISGQASWLSSDQKDTALSTPFALAGTAFNPPHLRARAGVIWQSARLTLSCFVNYIGGITDSIVMPSVKEASMTTADATAIYRVKSASPVFHNVQLSLSVQNLTNADPPRLDWPSFYAPYYAPYDSTNYSALGRVVSVSIGKRW
jgi:iron complex outermembrane receptor protein